MHDGVATDAAVDVGKKVISTSSLITHIVERRIEYLLGTLVAYQLGLLDQLVSAGQTCLA
jgi:hypothetical protein